MSSVTINSESTSLMECLATSIDTKSDITVVDYVVNSGTMDEEKSFIDQEDSSVVVQVVLHVNAEKLKDTDIVGYDLKIENTEGAEYEAIEILEISFMDDFEDIINTGEDDFDTILDKIKATQSLLHYQDSHIHQSSTTVYADKSPAFVDLETTSNFSAIAKDFLLNGVSIDDTIDLQMPLYAVASAQTGIGGTFGNGDLTKTQGIITYQQPYNDRISLSKKRSKFASENILSSEEGAVAQLSVPQTTPEVAGPTKTVVGQYIKFTTPIFQSKRRFEVPKRVWKHGVASLRFTFTPRLKSQATTTEPKKESVLYSFSENLMSLFVPEIPPSVQITRNDYGNVSLVVHKGDPSCKTVEIKTTYYDVNSKSYNDYGSSLLIDVSKTDSYTIPIWKCLNYGPYIGSIQAIAHSAFGVGLSSETVIPNLYHKEYGNDFVEDLAVVTAVNQSSSITVTVTNALISGATSIMLIRECLTLPSSSGLRTKVVGIATPASEIIFNDDTALQGHTYRYYTEAEIKHERLYKQATTIYEKRTLSGDFVITRNYTPDPLFTPMPKNPAPNVKPPVLVCLTAVSPSSYNRMIQMAQNIFQTQGLGEEASKNALDKILTDNPDELVKFLVYNVTRINLKTGETISLGEYMNGDSVYDLDPAYSLTSAYRYIFKLSVISPFGIMTLSKSLTDKASYFLEKQFIEATGVLGGTVVPETFDTSRYATGQEFVIDVPAILPKLKVGKITGSTLPSGFDDGKPALKIEWDVDPGTNKHVKSYYVVCEYSGHTNILKTIHASDSTSVYYHTDTDYFNEIGKKTYYVLVQMNDMSFAHKSNELTYTKHIDMSAPALAHATVTETASDKGLDSPLGTFVL